MANTVSAAMFPEIWSNAIQANLQKSLVALETCDTSLEAELKYGDKVHFPYINAIAACDYTPGTAISIQNFTAVDDSIDVNTFKVCAFYVDDIDALQTKANFAAHLAQDAAYQLRDAIDATALANVSAGVYFGDPSASSGNYATGTSANTTAIASTSANIDDVFVAGRAWLRKLNVPENGDWIAIMRPEIAADIETLVIDKGFNMSDATLKNGYAGDFLGFHCYVSNNMTSGHMYLGRRGGIHVIVQKDPSMVIKEVDNQLGRNFLPSIVFGTKAFVNDAAGFLDVRITS